MTISSEMNLAEKSASQLSWMSPRLIRAVSRVRASSFPIDLFFFFLFFSLRHIYGQFWYIFFFFFVNKTRRNLMYKNEKQKNHNKPSPGVQVKEKKRKEKIHEKQRGSPSPRATLRVSSGATSN